MHPSVSSSQLLPTAASKQGHALVGVKLDHSRKQASHVVIRSAMSPHSQARSAGQPAGLVGGTISEVWSDLKAAFGNKFVWYLGAVKFFKDIAGFGISESLPVSGRGKLRLDESKEGPL
jgi:hypothetical protein